MTANVSIVVAQRDQVLKVPNAALRFSPPPGDRAEDRGVEAKMVRAEGRPGVSGSAENGERFGGHSRRIWKLGVSGDLEAVTIQTGISDGVSTEVAAGPVAEGDLVVVGIDTARNERRAGDLPPGFSGGQRRSSRDRGL
jgi:HlyD family secretion protein